MKVGEFCFPFNIFARIKPNGRKFTLLRPSLIVNERTYASCFFLHLEVSLCLRSSLPYPPV